MNPQTKSEAERILSVLDDMLCDLDVIAYLPNHYGSMSKDDIAQLSSAAADSSIPQLLSQHFDLERKLEIAIDPADVDQHSKSTLVVTSLLRNAGFGQDFEPQTQPADSVFRFKKIISILRGLMNNNFSTTVEEDDQKLQILRDTVSREQHASADVKALNREFMTERKLRQTEVLKKDQAIHKLMEELEEVQRKAHEDVTDYDRIAQERQLLEEQHAAQEEQELEQKVEELESQLQRLKDANQKDEGLLRADRKKKENNLSTIIHDYDKEMTQKSVEKDKLQREYEEDSAQLAKVEEELKIYEEENNKWLEDDQVKMDRLKHRAVIRLRLEDSTKTVQAFWRGFTERNNLKKRGKKGKGKSKK
eukprot:TRINITY_DN12450_c0_g1_i1.p1 TRINITY_DN12450_c0_g1~~TRINITY_DN12450_c0_g1_i1.p1  ORF type:complete len:375 (+),score=93.36 TRINITY_DN12450_c0_g1_i1:37-1125(+)